MRCRATRRRRARRAATATWQSRSAHASSSTKCANICRSGGPALRDPACILVVDDNPANVDIIETRLASQGFRIITAADGEEAIAQARKHTPDLILLDVMMPKKDGLQVCRELKGDPSLPFMPIILVTAKGDTKDIIAGLDSGGDEYLTKPVDTAALLARVRSILRIKALHDQVEAQARE